MTYEERVRELEKGIKDMQLNNSLVLESRFRGKLEGLKEGYSLGRQDRTSDMVFHDHIKAHFEKEHPDWKVICKICGKSYEDVVGGIGERKGNSPLVQEPRKGED